MNAPEMKPPEEIIKELHVKCGIAYKSLEKFTLFEIDRIYQRMKRRERHELYQRVKCLHTFWTKKTYRQECRLNGKECKYSVESVQDTSCKKYQHHSLRGMP